MSMGPGQDFYTNISVHHKDRLGVVQGFWFSSKILWFWFSTIIFMMGTAQRLAIKQSYISNARFKSFKYIFIRLNNPTKINWVKVRFKVFFFKYWDRVNIFSTFMICKNGSFFFVVFNTIFVKSLKFLALSY